MDYVLIFFVLGIVGWFWLRKFLFGGGHLWIVFLSTMLFPSSLFAQQSTPICDVRYTAGAIIDDGTGTNSSNTKTITWGTGVPNQTTGQFANITTATAELTCSLTNFGNYYQGAMLQGLENTTTTRLLIVRLYIPEDDVPYVTLSVDGGDEMTIYRNSTTDAGGGVDTMHNDYRYSELPGFTGNYSPAVFGFGTVGAFGEVDIYSVDGNHQRLPTTGPGSATQPSNSPGEIAGGKWMENLKDAVGGGGENEGDGVFLRAKDAADIARSAGHLDGIMFGPGLRFSDQNFESAETAEASVEGLAAFMDNIQAGLSGSGVNLTPAFAANALNVESFGQLLLMIMYRVEEFYSSWDALFQWTQLIGSIFVVYQCAMYGFEQVCWALGWRPFAAAPPTFLETLDD